MALIRHTARLSVLAAGVGFLAALVSAGSAASADPAYEVVNQSPTQTPSDGTAVTSTYGEGAGIYSGDGNAFFYTAGPADSTVTWTFSQPVRSVVVYYTNVNSGDTELFTTNTGPVNFASIAGGGNKVASAGYENPDQSEGTYQGDVVSCDNDIDVCSGSVDLSFPGGVTSITAASSGSATAGYNDIGIGVNTASDTPPAVAPTITTASFPTATIGTAYSQAVHATGTAPITYTVTAGALPAGLTLNAATGVVSGTPTTAGTATFSIAATNTAGTSTKSFTIHTAAPTVAPTITTTTIPSGTVGTMYDTTIAATGTGPLSYTITSGNLPAGLTLDPVTGHLSGTPSRPGVYSYTVQAANAAGISAKTYTQTIAAHTAAQPSSTDSTAELAYTGSNNIGPGLVLGSLLLGIGLAATLATQLRRARAK